MVRIVVKGEIKDSTSYKYKTIELKGVKSSLTIDDLVKKIGKDYNLKFVYLYAIPKDSFKPIRLEEGHSGFKLNRFEYIEVNQDLWMKRIESGYYSEPEKLSLIERVKNTIGF